MFSLRPDLAAMLADARGRACGVPLTMLDDPPPGYGVLHRSVSVPGSDLARCGAALLDWEVHRRSGLRVAADGPARAGGTVVLATRLLVTWAVAPCRVVRVLEESDRVGFAYATLPGHPEHGVEEFAFVRQAGALRFEVRAVSRPVLRASRVFPAPQHLVQRVLTQRYLDAAVTVARRAPG